MHFSSFLLPLCFGKCRPLHTLRHHRRQKREDNNHRHAAAADPVPPLEAANERPPTGSSNDTVGQLDGDLREKEEASRQTPMADGARQHTPPHHEDYHYQQEQQQQQQDHYHHHPARRDRTVTPAAVPTTQLSLINSAALAQRPPRASRTPSQQQHERYLATLEVPTLDEISRIAQAQEAKEREIARRYELEAEEEDGDDDSRRRARELVAAGRIQRTYRGHRARREMAGLTLDPTTRWVEALKSARYQNITDPKRRRRTPSPGRGAGAGDGKTGEEVEKTKRSLDARSNWHHVSSIASHAMGELPQQDDSGRVLAPSSKPHRASMDSGEAPSLLSSSSSSSLSSDGESKPDVLHRLKAKRQVKRRKRKQWGGKMMDLPYFLEMVDVKHRYGSNLRAYHAEWKRRDTHENFFYWLDYGEGRDVEIDTVSRERLEKEQVRYLSREERLNYLVNIDSDGRLVWAKNGRRITTSTDYRDSVDGIVPTDSAVKMFREDEIKAIEGRARSSSSTSSSSSHSAANAHPDPETTSISSSISSIGSAPASPVSTPDVSDAERRYPDPQESGHGQSNGLGGAARQTVKSVSAHAVLNRLMRQTLSKNTWIFAADTSMNLYVGIKQSGAFQHSSFMRGARLSAAGTVRIKRGQLRALNPLSGHYRPPARAFRHFVAHLRARHADLSRVSVSKSYAVLVGLEAYKSANKGVKKAEAKVARGFDVLAHPSRARDERERGKDHSRSAQIERDRRRKEMGTLGRVLEDARDNVEERWVALREPVRPGREGRAEAADAAEAKEVEEKVTAVRAGEEVRAGVEAAAAKAESGIGAGG